MRKMKTALDVKIRQKGMRQLQYRNLRMRRRRRSASGAFELREEVLEELPETYRKTFCSLSPRQREQILASIEKKVDRRFLGGTLPGASILSGDGIEKDRPGAAASGSGMAAKREMIVRKYRLSERASKAGRVGYSEYPEVTSSLPEGKTIERVPEEAVLKDRIQRQQLQQKQVRQKRVRQKQLSQIQLQHQQLRPGQRSTYMRQADSQDLAAVSGAVPEEWSDLPENVFADRLIRQENPAGHAPYMRDRQKEADASIGVKLKAAAKERTDGQAFSERQAQAEKVKEASLQAQKKKAVSDREAEALANRQDTALECGADNISNIIEQMKKNSSINDDMYTDAEIQRTSSLYGLSQQETARLRQEAEIRHRQKILQAANDRGEKSRAERVRAEKVLTRNTRPIAEAVRVDAGRMQVLESAGLGAVYTGRATGSAYAGMLAGAGIRKESRKEAIRATYEKQLRKALKNEYRKQLTGKLSRIKTFSIMRAAQVRRFQKELAEENEFDREMTEQTRESFDILSKGGRAFRRIAQDAARAVKALVRNKLPVLILPLLLAIAVPVVLASIPLLTSLTTAAYEDNEVYAYADAAELIAYAKSWIGKIPYVWGGGHGGSPTAWQSGCDCSGFVHGVFNHFGYEIGGDTGAMETQAGTHIAYDSLAQAKPGDVLIYYRTGAHVKGQPNGNGSTHVSIYIGNSQIIHQSGGVHISNEYHQYFEVRRVLTPDAGGRGNIYGGLGGMGTYGHRIDASNYSQSDMELIWAIVAQEDNGSYKGALAVISSAMNRVESPKWSFEGSNALAQLTAPGQYCYSNDTYWQARLGGNVPSYVKQAVYDCLKKGKRNHNHTSFRSTRGKTTGSDAVQIGGNWYFDY